MSGGTDNGYFCPEKTYKHCTEASEDGVRRCNQWDYTCPSLNVLIMVRLYFMFIPKSDDSLGRSGDHTLGFRGR